MPRRSMDSLVDERLLAIAIDEVLSNAVKYSFAYLPVDVFLDSFENKFWRISIHDFGIRIPEDKLEEVFKPGRRLMLEKHYQGHERPGFGMGLAYVKAIIEKHEGSVLISCTPSLNARVHPFYKHEQMHEVVVKILNSTILKQTIGS